MDKHDVETIVLRKSPNTAWFSGSRVPGSAKIDPMQLDLDASATIAPEVLKELEQWSERLS